MGHMFGDGFMPHGHCYLWSPAMVTAQVGSNLLIGLAYLSIAITLTILVRRITNIPFAWVYLAFGVFIMSCGLTHFLDVVTVWQPIYWVDAAVRIMTAIASVGTAVLLVPLFPKAVALADTARLSQERGRRLESTVLELERAHRQLAEREEEARKRAETSEEQLRSLVETMPQLAWITDPKGANVFRNQRWSEYTGLSLNALELHGWRSVHDPELIDSVSQAWDASIASGQPFEIESRLRRYDGEYRWFLARAMPWFDKQGHITGWVGTLTDIHEQRMARDEALNTARLKDDFLATVSHELRTPLNAILGWSRLLYDRSLSEDARSRALEAVQRNALAQAQLVADILDVSRIISGKMQLARRRMNVLDVVQVAVEALRPAADARGVRIKLELVAAPLFVIADGTRLQQVFWNLLDNAVKFSKENGVVTVRVAHVGERVHIAVSDDGIGISAEFLPHIFERFAQADSSIQRRHGGLGLGLAIAQHLTALHDGVIRVESEGEGLGATFIVDLPLAAGDQDETALEPRRLAHANGELRGLRVLLVEDDSDARELVTILLSGRGAQVTAASDADEALAFVAERTFDVILSDIGLPGRDGLELMQALRAIPAVKAVPAVAITAYARPEDEQKALAAGYQVHVSKPIDPSALIDVIMHLARTTAV